MFGQVFKLLDSGSSEVENVEFGKKQATQMKSKSKEPHIIIFLRIY